MDINEFSAKLKLAVEAILTDNETVRISPMWKNNGVRLLGLCIMEQGKNVAPTFYLEDYYRRFLEGEAMEALAKELLKLNQKYQIEHSFEVDFFLDFEKAKKHIAFRLINKERNFEILKKIPHIIYLDFAIVFYYLLDHEEFGSGTILIHNSHLELWKINQEMLYQIALQNTPKLLPIAFSKMDHLLLEMAQNEAQRKQLLRDFEGVDIRMYVATNDRKQEGAAILLYPEFSEKVKQIMTGDFYIIPSSIHELILVPKDGGQENVVVLNEMVREVNATQLDEREILSNHVYLFDEAEQKIISCI